MKLPSKKVLIVTGVLLAGGLGGVAALNAPASGGADTSPLVQQVQHNTDELGNHEARIGNTENNVKDLQNKTGTTPSSTQTTVPSVTSTAPTQPITPPAPATITAFQQIDLGGGLVDCKLTYSDGTTYQWHWKTLGTQPNGQSILYTNGGSCSSARIGESK